MKPKFIENKYTRWYQSIVNNALNRERQEGYYEKHHIIPKCLGGKNYNSNLVYLTAREHFICHYLLTKMHGSYKLKYAFIMMLSKNSHQINNRFVPNSRYYEKSKIWNSELASKKFTGKQKHNVGKVRAYNIESGEIRMFQPEEIPNSWVRGNSPSMKEAQGLRARGRVHYYHPETMEVIGLPPNKEPPIGFVKGNPNAATRAATDTVMYYNPVNGEVKRFKPNQNISHGWIRGSPYMWVNDGSNNSQVLKMFPIPEGFVKGKKKK